MTRKDGKILIKQREKGIKNYDFILKKPIKVTARSLAEAKRLLDEEYLVPDFNSNRFNANEFKFSKISKPTKENLDDYITNEIELEDFIENEQRS